ncbi:LOW QUALITY PROTEIN: uncharacterized protein Dyak_GE22651 [Drosophila yakuba]|uniref:MADF domain-containing protein n=1 Tax=Drosophila yakuba TaxID=7245 RepID=B4PJ53_DROYA|nr:LOW QUALITY PROTEIN: uncharacterized protein Dyak_GE22651 [Drosophila yakuba]
MAPVSGCFATATHSLQDMSAAAAAIALDMKPKLEPHPSAAATVLPSQKIKKLVRRNASDKLKLIQMVHDNPILWDSRLPNFKGAEEEKNRAWEHIGREFNAPGRRVARAFKSLRESYRRELAHVKLMGNGFKPKWSLYEAMDFLRDVIRERKGATHATDLSLTAYGHISNNNNNSNNLVAGGKAMTVKVSNSFNESAAVLNLSKCSSLNVSGDHYYCDYYVKPELDLSVGGGGGSSTSGSSSGGGQLPLPAHQHQAHNDSRVSSTRNEHRALQHSYEDIDDSSIRSGDEDTGLTSDVVEELDAIDADFPYPLILDSNSRGSPNAGVDEVVLSRKLRRTVDQDSVEEGNGHGSAVIDGDDYEEQMLQQHRHLRQQQGVASGVLDLPPPQTVREVLNSKFCGFISAKLNSMDDSDADNLMNRILLLLVQVQQCEGSSK